MFRTTVLLLALLMVIPVFADEVALTIYNNNLALVHEFRNLEFQKGTFEHQFTSIPSQIIPTSVLFRADGVVVLEQNYEYDLASPDKIIDKFIGEKIRVFTEKGDMYEGTLQPSGWGGFVLVDDKGKVQILEKSKITYTEFPHMPKDFLSRPTLVWQLQSKASGKKKSEISYLTEGMSWHAEYIAVAGKDKLGFTGWVSINNQSGVAYQDAKLKLMAGEVNRVYQPMDRRMKAESYLAAGTNAPQFAEKAFFEYHLYTLQRPATLKNNQVKQISLFPEAMVDYKKEYRFDSAQRDADVGVYLVFRNDSKSGLGMPLPAGKVRVYKQDEDGTQEFIGEDLIDHTPRDEEVKVKTGNAFDIVGERVKADMRNPARNIREEDYEIKLRNRKEEPVEVIVAERFQPYWDIIKTNYKYNKIDATTVEFTVMVPPHKGDEELVIKYTVRYVYNN